MPKAFKVSSCSCSNKGSVEGLLRCAPCPPPMILYKEFRDHALNRNLLLKEVCRIARRCNIGDTDIDYDCPPDKPICPPTTSIPIYKAGTDSGLIVVITVVIAIISLSMICVRKRPEIIMKMFKYNFRKRKRATTHIGSGKGEVSSQIEVNVKLSDKTYAEKENDDETKVTIHHLWNTADESIALMHDVSEKASEMHYVQVEYPLKESELIVEIANNDTDDNKNETHTNEVHEIKFHEDGRETESLEEHINENVETISEKKSEASIQENLAATVKSNSDKSVQEYNDTSSIGDDSSYSTANEEEDMPFVDS